MASVDGVTLWRSSSASAASAASAWSSLCRRRRPRVKLLSSPIPCSRTIEEPTRSPERCFSSRRFGVPDVYPTYRHGSFGFTRERS